jgi:hypothetical protein
MWEPQRPPIPPPDPNAPPLRPEEDELDAEGAEQTDAERPTLTCPLCGCQKFDEEKERTDTRWGMFTHVKTLMICRRCRYILQFYGGASIFDFD